MPHRPLRSLFCAAALALTLAGCLFDSKEDDGDSLYMKGRVYTHAELRYRITFPKGWHAIVMAREPGDFYHFYAAPDTSGGAHVMGLALWSLNPGETLEHRVDSIFASNPSARDSFHVLPKQVRMGVEIIAVDTWDSYVSYPGTDSASRSSWRRRALFVNRFGQLLQFQFGGEEGNMAPLEALPAFRFIDSSLTFF